MKKIIFGTVVMMAIFIGYVGFSYQQEVVVPAEADLAKYPELLPFQTGRSGFRGIKFDVDTNEYSFAFPVSFDDAESFFTAVETAVTGSGWSSTKVSSTEREYSRRKALPIGPLVGEQVTLRYDPQRREVTLLRQDVAR